MGFMLFRKRPLDNNIMSGNPSKKIKLDFQNDGNSGNDDLWGQDDDITAEEFDMLEIQATQSCNQNNSLLNNALQINNLYPKSNNSVEIQDSKQLQYELEGRVKLLSLSLKKSTKELNEERLNRDGLINERIKQFQERETNMKKEVEKMQSILEFKEQEMKSTYSKLQILKFQLQDKKCTDNDICMNSNFDDFLKSSKCDGPSSFRQKNFLGKYHRKHKLAIDTPKGEVNGIEILSSILCSRLAAPSFANKESIVNSGCLDDPSYNSSLTPITVLHLKNERKCDEILEYYHNFLKNHVNILKTLASKHNQVSSNKSFSIPTKLKEAYCSQTVISYLKDIIYVYSDPSFKSHYEKSNIEHESPSNSMHIQKTERESSSCVQQNEKVTVSDSTLSLLQSLSALSNPETYPIGYCKTGEIEFALSALLSICLSCPKNFLDLIGELPCYFLINPHQSMTGLCTTIKLLIVLCSSKSFVTCLAHRESKCILCLIATFLHDAVPADPEKFAISLILVEDFLSSIFSTYNYKKVQFTCSCVSAIIQGMIKSLWKYFQIREDNTLRFEILKKGFLLLHFIASNIPNFKENRSPVEDEYVALVSGILAFSKENSELRELYDVIHSLWDFQVDMSEFDSDELSEEAHACTNDTDIE